MDRVLERFDVELELGPTAAAAKTRVVVGGVDVTRALQGVRVMSHVRDITTVELDLIPREMVFARIEDAAVIPFFADDRPDAAFRARVALAVEALVGFIDRMDEDTDEAKAAALAVDSAIIPPEIQRRFLVERESVSRRLERDVLVPLRKLLKGED